MTCRAKCGPELPCFSGSPNRTFEPLLALAHVPDVGLHARAVVLAHEGGAGAVELAALAEVAREAAALPAGGGRGGGGGARGVRPVPSGLVIPLHATRAVFTRGLCMCTTHV